MKKSKKLLEGLIAFVTVLALFMSPLSDSLPVIGEGIKVSAAGNEYAMFPLAQLSISQGEGTGSHVYSYALDLVGTNKNVYAPFTGTIVYIDTTNYGAGHRVVLQSDNEVIFADGSKGIMTVKFNHDNDISDLYKGKKIKQGEIFYQQGNYGNVTGVHVHIECAKGAYAGQEYKGTEKYAVLKNAIHVYDALWLSPSTTINNTKGYNWRTSSGTTDITTVKNYDDTHKNTITDTNAIIYGQVDKPKGYNVTKYGIRMRVEGDTYANGWSRYDNTKYDYTNVTYMGMYYDMNEELNLTLTHTTTYFFQFYAVVNGQEYWSEEGKFTTTGSHSYGSWTTTKAATCTETGTQTRTCSCGAKETQTISALGHSWSSSWSTDGSNHWLVCTRCSSIKDNATHNWDSGKITQEPTCNEKGVKTYTCQTCKQTKTEVINALGHSWSATWSNDNNNHWHICTRCNSTNDKTAHSFKTQIVDPTGSSQGYTLHTCSVCSYSYKDNYTSSVATCAHKNTKEVATNATCGKDGKIETVCKDCGETVSSKNIPATGVHSWNNGKETKKATCTESGVITYTCTICGKTKTETSAALGHSFGSWGVTKEATYTREGQRSHVCKLCGKTETETLPKLTQSGESNSETITTSTVPEPEITDHDINGNSNGHTTNNNEYPDITTGSNSQSIIDDVVNNDNSDVNDNIVTSENTNIDGNASAGSESTDINDNVTGNSDNNPVDTSSSDTNNIILIVDEATKIELSNVDGIIPNGAQLKVVINSDNQSDTHIVYDITLVDTNGDHIQIGGNVTVKIPIPTDWDAHELYIYREENDGTYTDMDVTYDEDYAMFTTEHFSTYVLTSVKRDTSITGDLFETFDIITDDGENNSNIYIYVIIAVAILMAAAAAVLIMLALRKHR